MVDLLLRRRSMMTVGGGSPYIVFADPAVEAICVANWSSDGIGLTLADAAAVTTIGTKFRFNANITSFDEFEYFTGVSAIDANAFQNCTALASIKYPSSLQTIGAGAFSGCSSLTSPLGSWPNVTSISYNVYYNVPVTGELDAPSLLTMGRGYSYNENIFRNSGITGIANLGSVTYIPGYCFSAAPLTYAVLPATLTYIGNNAFTGCSSLATITCHATTPPTLLNASLQGITPTAIYVPAASVAAYKSAQYWSNFASIIQAIP